MNSKTKSLLLVLGLGLSLGLLVRLPIKVSVLQTARAAHPRYKTPAPAANGDSVDVADGDDHLSANSLVVDTDTKPDAMTHIGGKSQHISTSYDIGSQEFLSALSISKQASPSPVLDGAPLTYTIRVTNTTNLTLTATVTDFLPGHVTPTGVQIWTPTITAPGGVWMHQFTVTVDTGYTGTLTNKVQVSTEARAENDVPDLSDCTTCAEEDNVNIPLYAPLSDHFRVTAKHPGYPIDEYDCPPDFSGCDFSAGSLTAQAVDCQDLWDEDGINVIKLCTDPGWWLPNTMSVKVDDQVASGHWLVWYRKISDASSWPEFMVLYQDGNMRLKPHVPSHAPAGADNCFGSSVIIGPAPPATRPYLEIQEVVVDPSRSSLNVTYRDGGGAYLELSVDREEAVAEVWIDYDRSQPFATFRSMYVSDGNADADHVLTPAGNFRILSNPPPECTTEWESLEGPWWFFHRAVPSSHNPPAPDILVEVTEGRRMVSATVCANRCLHYLPIIMR